LAFGETFKWRHLSNLGQIYLPGCSVLEFRQIFTKN
jgi:hypothetical protein